MQIFLSLLLFLSSFKLPAACNFKNEINKVFALSGSTAVVLKELGLLSHPKVKGISVFAPIKKSEYKGKIYPGGIFLSHKTLTDFDDSVVFYDESRELKRIFESQAKVRAEEIKTRNLTPLQALDATTLVLSTSLAGCEKKIAGLKKKALKLQQQILSKLPKVRSMIFFIGSVKHGRLPEMIMANDGIVKWLRNEQKIITYPSDLAYVNWSAKILQSFGQEALFVVIKDPGREERPEVNKSSGMVTLSYSGSLVPGLSQLEAFSYFFNHL
jgi:hypothetical protein